MCLQSTVIGLPRHLSLLIGHRECPHFRHRRLSIIRPQIPLFISEGHESYRSSLRVLVQAPRISRDILHREFTGFLKKSSLIRRRRNSFRRWNSDSDVFGYHHFLHVPQWPRSPHDGFFLTEWLCRDSELPDSSVSTGIDHWVSPSSSAPQSAPADTRTRTLRKLGHCTR